MVSFLRRPRPARRRIRTCGGRLRCRRAQARNCNGTRQGQNAQKLNGSISRQRQRRHGHEQEGHGQARRALGQAAQAVDVLGARAANQEHHHHERRGRDDAVVDHLRKVNKVDRIHIIGWSAGGPRVGGYVSQNPGKIDRVMLYAPSPVIKGPIPDKPAAGFPVQNPPAKEP